MVCLYQDHRCHNSPVACLVLEKHPEEGSLNFPSMASQNSESLLGSTYRLNVFDAAPLTEKLESCKMLDETAEQHLPVSMFDVTVEVTRLAV